MTPSPTLLKKSPSKKLSLILLKFEQNCHMCISTSCIIDLRLYSFYFLELLLWRHCLFKMFFSLFLIVCKVDIESYLCCSLLAVFFIFFICVGRVKTQDFIVVIFKILDLHWPEFEFIFQDTLVNSLCAHILIIINAFDIFWLQIEKMK